MQASMEQIINDIEQKGGDKAESLDFDRLAEDSVPMKPVN